jgi:flagellar basal body-associated protein FliL
MSKKVIIIILVAVIVAAAGTVYYTVIKKPPEKIESYYKPGDYFVTNIKDSPSLIKTTIVLELYAYEKDLEDINKYLTKNNHVIRDIIVFKLRSMTEEELLSQDVAEALRKDLVKSINDQMDIDYITTVYFNDYVIQ